MKKILLLLLLVFNLTLFSQSKTYDGDYGSRTETKRGEVLEWTLSLNPDGTFLYNFYRNLNCANCPEENFYGKGKWKAEKKLIFFYANENDDIDEIHTLNFNNSKARINSKSPRDKSERIIKESIRFYSSETPAIKGLELFKKK